MNITVMPSSVRGLVPFHNVVNEKCVFKKSVLFSWQYFWPFFFFRLGSNLVEVFLFFSFYIFLIKFSFFVEFLWSCCFDFFMQPGNLPDSLGGPQLGSDAVECPPPSAKGPAVEKPFWKSLVVFKHDWVILPIVIFFLAAVFSAPPA